MKKPFPLNVLTVAAMILALAAGMGSLSWAYDFVQDWHQRRTQESAVLGPEAVRDVYRLLDEEYFRAVDGRELMAGAIDGMRGALEGKVQADLPEIPESLEADAAADVFEQAFQQAEEAAAGAVSREELIYSALRGMIDYVDDNYTAVMDPTEYQRLDEQMSGGNFGGVGIYIEQDPESERLTVVEPIDGTPAAEAGLATGDWILRIDGEDTLGMEIEAAASRIRGELGTTVALTVQRGEGEPFEVTLERRTIHVSSAKHEMLPNGIGYIRLRYFGQETRAEFEGALEAVGEQGARALVLDLRNNGGGYINAALDVCSCFLDRGELVVSVVNPRIRRDEAHNSTGAREEELPMVVLVNEYSASASEITAGALKDHRIATLIGRKTFGKASVQAIHVFPDGGAVKYTVAHYLTPNGRDIHADGIAPDVVVEAEPSRRLGGDDDLQLQAALRHLEGELARSDGPRA